MLLSVGELAGTRTDPLVVDCRSFKEYSGGHIPGAVNLDLFGFHWIDTSAGGMRGFAAQMHALFSYAGVSNDRQVVFYDDVSGMLAARGVWILRYLSHQRAFMLDGGLTRWRADGQPVEAKTQRFQPAAFLAVPNAGLAAGFEEIRDRIGEPALIDARSADEYNGAVSRAARPGHIPGAINVDYSMNISGDGTMRDEASLLKLYGMPKDARVVTYCHGGYRAANTFVALKTLGFQDVRVYLGSWGEWGNREELPAERSA